MPIATLSGVLSGALQGMERFFELNLISVGSTALFQLLPLATAEYIKVDLAYILPAALCARLFAMVVLFFVCQRM